MATATSGAVPPRADGDGGCSAARGDDLRLAATSVTGRAAVGAAGSRRRPARGDVVWVRRTATPASGRPDPGLAALEPRDPTS
ncbi:hypothetical protein OsJ_30661 [Oryza sativa Japonica Group]|uniref:Uncharacterized protein n=1 Tax=Oryza sativa subsp. japonica TaxID=39947 RepID=B9G7F8_ORYSJ|nr:hypothetical protein OsJ_30661 [Oryza sativa Japonica Group]